MKSKAFFATLAIAVALAMTINIAYAATSASIIMVNAAGNPVTHYNIGETIRVLIVTTDAPIVNLEIRVSGVGGAWVENANLPGPYMEGTTYTFAGLQAGYYMLYADRIPVGSFAAAASFHVIPESILGTLMATVASFGAFATIKIVKRKQTKNK